MLAVFTSRYFCTESLRENGAHTEQSRHHIEDGASPPLKIAVASGYVSVPTCAAIAVTSAWKEDIDVTSPSSFS